jgi:Skp family chaperone for outer membrane proteins
MASIVSAVSELEARRKALELELAGVNSKLKAIQQALEVSARSGSNGAERASAGASQPRSETAARRPGRKKVRKLRQWFTSGEALKMMKKIVRAPMTAAEIVKALAREKGYDKALPPEQLKRFHGTAYMAVSNAVKAGNATRLKDGRVRIR